jgi:colicin import membrane protein
MAKAKKSKAKKPGKKKAIKRAAAKSRKRPAKAKKPAPRKAKKAAPVKARKAATKKKQIVGEGNYAAAKAFDKDQTNFVKRNKAKIPEMGKEAEQALEGREGPSLIAAEQEAMSRSMID